MTSDAHTSPFLQVLKPWLHELPRSIIDFHSSADESEWQGQASVIAASNPLARLVAIAFGFPTTAGTTPVTVSVTQRNDKEVWRRDFGGSVFHSSLSLGSGMEESLVCERFGAITVALEIVWDNDKLFFIPRRWRLGPIPLANSLLPRGSSFESDDDGQFAFNVELAAPLLGRIVAYRGTLTRSN